MTVNLRQKLENLITLNKLKVTLNNKIKTQITNEQTVSEALSTFYRPVTDTINLSKQVAIPEKKNAIEENLIIFEPYQIDDKNINPRLQAKSIVPKFQNKMIKGILYESVIINNKEFITFLQDKIPFIYRNNQR